MEEPRDAAYQLPPKGGTTNRCLAPRYSPDHQKRFCARGNRVGQRRVRQFVRQIFSACEEPQEGTPLAGDVIAYRPAQHRVARLERSEHRTLRNLTSDFELNLIVDPGQCSQMVREHHSDHANTCTSTDSTAGRSRTIGAQVSPASADAYTCPPVVPKYTPHESSESTAIASRSTLT